MPLYVTVLLTVNSIQCILSWN